MQKRDSVLVLTALLVIIVLVGQVLIPTVSYSYSSDASLGDDAVEYSLSADVEREFIVSLYTGGNHYAGGDVVLYYDDGYGCFSNPVEVVHLTDSLQRDLPLRGVDTEVRDAEGIADMMREAVRTGDTSMRLVMLSGVIPDTVYDGEGGLIVDWLKAGGVLYWMGAPLGMYLAHEGDFETVEEYSELFFGTDDAVLSPGQTPGYESAGVVYGDIPDNGMSASLGLVANDCTFGIKTDSMPDTLRVASSDDGGYSSIALTKFHDGDGMICVFGGYITYDSVWAMSKVIASGLEYDSEIVETQTGRVSTSGYEGTIGSAGMTGKLRLYICIGVPIEFYGKCYTF